MQTNEVQRIKPLYRGTQIIWAIVGVINVLLLFRFLLKLLGANDGAAFTNFIYLITTPFAGPFIYVFDLMALYNSVIEFGTILAMLVYTLIGAGIVKLLAMSKPVSTVEANQKLNENE